MTKQCSKCKQVKPASAFHKDTKNKSGLRDRCKVCIKKFAKQTSSNYAPSPRVLLPTATRQIALYKKGLKECIVCKEVLALSAYRKTNKSKNYNGYEARCLDCMKQYKKERHALKNLDIRKFLYEYRATKGCFDCGIKDPRLLEFDHLRDKEFNLGKAHVLKITLKEVKREVRKCVVRCSNCHKLKTHKEQDTWVNNYYETQNARA